MTLTFLKSPFGLHLMVNGSEVFRCTNPRDFEDAVTAFIEDESLGHMELVFNEPTPDSKESQ